MRKAGKFLAVAAAMAALATGPVSAQELKDESVKTFMEYAWQLTPAQFTKPNSDVIKIDKAKKAEVMVPVDVAREVIKVGRLSAYAQVCELKEDQVNNYRSLMYREEDKNKWTPQQLIYISQLHLTTVMLLTGKIKLVQKDGDKEVVVEESKSNNQTCADDQRAKVKELIAAYVKAGPAMKTPPATADAAAAGAGAAPAAAAPAPAAPAAAPAAPKK